MKPFNKEELNKCVTWEDARVFFKNLDTKDLRNFINSLENAKNFIDLTMRDDFLLTVAKSELDICRG